MIPADWFVLGVMVWSVAVFIDFALVWRSVS